MERAHQLNRAATSGAPTSTFWYDAFGRRIETLSGLSNATYYLYDGLNPVQEQNTSSVTANLLTGLGLDEIFTRTDTSGTMSFLTDAIGSTYGLVNSSNSMPTTYTYGPFGQTTRNGTANGNPYQFTGRELDPNSGLYYLRNRYYSPTLQRFLSPDPMGIAGGDANLYAYAHNDPTNLIDPLGLSTEGVGGGGYGVSKEFPARTMVSGGARAQDRGGPLGGPSHGNRAEFAAVSTPDPK